jgi:hypothetical protein
MTLTKRQFNSAPRLKSDEGRREPQRDQSRPEKSSKESRDKRTDRSQSRKKTSSKTSPAPRIDKQCDGCGRIGHLRSNCRLANVHPDFNKTGKWTESEAGKKVSELKFDTRLNGDKFDFDAAKLAAEGKGETLAKTNRKEGPSDK